MLQIYLLELAVLHWDGVLFEPNILSEIMCTWMYNHIIDKLEVIHYSHLIWRKVKFYIWDPLCCKFHELKLLFFVGNSSKSLKNKWIFLIWLFWFVKSELRKYSNTQRCMRGNVNNWLVLACVYNDGGL
jgi:hypothetical protein